MTMTADSSTQTATDEVSTEEFVARAAALVPLLRKNSKQTEEDRRVVEENIEAIREAGLYRLMVPKRFGGHQADFTTFLQVSSELARGDGSTAWVSTLMNVCSWLAGLYPEQAQRDIFESDPDARICGVVAPDGDHDLRRRRPDRDRQVGLRLRQRALPVGHARHPGRRRGR